MRLVTPQLNPRYWSHLRILDLRVSGGTPWLRCHCFKAWTNRRSNASLDKTSLDPISVVQSTSLSNTCLTALSTSTLLIPFLNSSWFSNIRSAVGNNWQIKTLFSFKMRLRNLDFSYMESRKSFPLISFFFSYRLRNVWKYEFNCSLWKTCLWSGKRSVQYLEIDSADGRLTLSWSEISIFFLCCSRREKQKGT